LEVCADGQQAKEYLRAEGPFADRKAHPFPKLLITDLKMPRCSGLELLAWIKDHQKCSIVPTIVLSASPQMEDVQRAYELGANCYFCKPTSFDRLTELVQMIWQFWSEAMVPQMPRDCA
jgi:CheY-like chemotaxis protein